MPEFLKAEIGVKTELSQPAAILWSDQDIDGHDGLDAGIATGRRSGYVTRH